MSKVNYVLSNKQGITAIFGEVGTGKTTLLRMLNDSMPEEYVCIYVYSPNFTSESHMLKVISSEFGIPMRRSQFAQVEIFQQFLVDLYAADKTPVVIIDEGQVMKPKMLELMRQISNFETNESKLCQMVICGQTELKTKLKKHRALWSRIVMASSLEALSFDDTVEMISFRFCDIAKGDPETFPIDTLNKIYQLSKGIPRDTVLLCAAALEIAYRNQIKVISPDIVDVSYTDSQKR
jgi:general secretion pathway protein A